MRIINLFNPKSSPVASVWSVRWRLLSKSINLLLVMAVWLGSGSHFRIFAQQSSWLHLPGDILPDMRLEHWSENGFRFLAADDQAMSCKNIVRWGRLPGIIGRQALWLNDGSWLAGQIIQVDSSSILFQHRWLDLAPIALRNIRAVIYTPSASLHEWVSAMQTLQSIQGNDDTVWLGDGSRLTGVIDWPSSQSELRVPLTIEVQQQRIEIAWERISMLAVSPALVGPLPAFRAATLVGLEDGSLLNVQNLSYAAESIEMDLASLGTVKTLDSPQEFCRAVRYLDRSDIPGVSRLGDLQPLTYKFVPESELLFTLGVDQTVYGQPLVVGRRAQTGVVRHGLAMHSSSQVAYRWDQSPGKFLAEVCLANPADPSVPLGDVVCKVLLGRDRELTTAETFSISNLTARAATGPGEVRRVEVDITGAQLVVLVVEKARFGQWGDQVYWLDARFTRID